MTLMDDTKAAPRLKIISLFEASKVRHLTAEDVYRQLLTEGLLLGSYRASDGNGPMRISKYEPNGSASPGWGSAGFVLRLPAPLLQHDRQLQPGLADAELQIGG